MGGDGNDSLYAQETDSLIDGGSGKDTVYFAELVSAVSLEDGRLVSIENVVITNTGDASYDFSDQSEALNIVGNTGNDTITGGEHEDTITGGAGADHIDGGEAQDTASYAGSTAVTVDLRITGPQNPNGTGHEVGDVLTSIENLIGSDEADTLTGDDEGNLLTGGLGNDTLDGGVGVDSLEGGAGNDTLVARRW